MKIRFNEDQEVVNTIKEGLERTGGYCPCRMARTPENKCMCKEFREQIADPDYEGYCHCMLYHKEKSPRSAGPGPLTSGRPMAKAWPFINRAAMPLCLSKLFHMLAAREDSVSPSRAAVCRSISPG